MAEHFEHSNAAQEPVKEPARPKAAQSETAQAQEKELSRRGFLKTTAVAAAGAALGSRLALPAHAQATAGAAGGQVGAAVIQDGPVPQGPRLRVGLIGCGGRGTGAAGNCLDSSPNMEIYALGDLFPDRANGCRAQLTKDKKEKITVTDARVFTGFDAYHQVINSGVDMVILATPPGFRPIHLRAAVDAGKHVFMEKPVAVDATGIRSVIESGEIARRKNLAIVSGTQRRHQASYIETIKRIQAGAIGDIVTAQAYWNQGGLWMNPRQPGWSDLEWQLRNWLYFTWLSGDHIVEQHVHNLDVMNWVMGATPLSAYGMGGRQARTDPAYGHGYDHFAIEYEYPNNVIVTSQCRQQDGTDTRVGENVVGTLGRSDPGYSIRGKNSYKFEGNANDPYVQEHTDLVTSIRRRQPLNEAKRVAESTMTAIMGRMSAYTGKKVTWEQAMNSKENLMPANLDLKMSLPTPPVAIPGKTPLI